MDFNKYKLKRNKPKNSQEEEILIPFDFKFTKDNVVYEIFLRFPNGALLINYKDEQIPIIPFAFEDYPLDIPKDIKMKINKRREEIMRNNKLMKNNLLEKNRLKAKIQNNGNKENIIYDKLKGEID